MPSSDDRAALLAAAVKLLESLPGTVVLSIQTQGLVSTVTLPPRPAEPEGGCAADVLDVLRAAGRRLNAREILDEFQARGLEWSERTLRRYLAELMERGRVDNPEDASPRGYGLTGR